MYITKEIYFCYYCRRSCYLYILQNVCFYFARKKFCCCYSYDAVKVLESPGIPSKVLEKSWNFDAKSPGKIEKKSWKVLEFESFFFGGNHGEDDVKQPYLSFMAAGKQYFSQIQGSSIV